MAKKKSKKKSQKNRQAKALKRRSVKKQLSKTRPKRRMSVPNSMPGGMAQPPQNLMDFSEPLAMLAQPKSMEEMQSIAALIQGFWQGFAEQDTIKRDIKMASLKTIYEKQDWSSEMSFEELSDIMLKRHIHVLPESHSEEERNRFSEAEIEAAMAWNPLPDESDAEEADAATDEPAEEFDWQAVNTEAASSLLSDDERDSLKVLQSELTENYDNIDFYKADDPSLPQISDFHKRTLDFFKSYLEHTAEAPEDVKAHTTNLKAFLNRFLLQEKQNSLLKFDEDLAEEFMLDYAFRKMKTSEATEDLLPTSLAMFFDFAAQMELSESAGAAIPVVAEAKAEYDELLADKRDDDEDEAE